MLSQSAEDREHAQREAHGKAREASHRPAWDSAGRADTPRADAEPAPLDVQGIYHLLRSISHRLDRLEQRLDGREAAERVRVVRRARVACAAAVAVAAVVAAVAAWRLVPAGARHTPPPEAGRHATVDPAGES